MKDEIIRLQEVTRITGLSISSLRRLEIIGEFPSRVLIGSKAIGWLKSDIEDWFLSRPRVYGGKDGKK